MIEPLEAIERAYHEEIGRLYEHEGGDPHKVPLLSNWLGGMKYALKIGREAHAAHLAAQRPTPAPTEES